MKAYVLVLIAAFVYFQAGMSCAANASNALLRIAIVDTGYDKSAPGTKLKLCATGHYDYRTNTETVGFTNQHGTRVASIIAERLKNVNYCAVIIQVGDGTGLHPLENIVPGLARVARLQVDAVNYSFSGKHTSVAEREAISMLVRHGVGVFVAAGNKGKDLDKECDVFPACFDIPGMNVVGAVDKANALVASYSNRGSKVTLWYEGNWNANGQTDKGTSFASPRALSDYVLVLATNAKPTNIKLLSVSSPLPPTSIQTLTTTLDN